MTVAPVLPDQLMKEVDGSLALLDDVRAHARRDDVPAWLWLRAARACWLTASMELAHDFYRRAAVGFSAYALDAGRRSGNVEQYAQLALGAAWMSEDRDTLSEVGRQIDSHCDHQLTSFDNPIQLDIFLVSVLDLCVYNPISCGLFHVVWV